jgi:hypothetical protein
MEVEKIWNPLYGKVYNTNTGRQELLVFKFINSILVEFQKKLHTSKKPSNGFSRRVIESVVHGDLRGLLCAPGTGSSPAVKVCHTLDSMQ